jgi:hypothetical protein
MSSKEENSGMSSTAVKLAGTQMLITVRLGCRNLKESKALFG